VERRSSPGRDARSEARTHTLRVLGSRGYGCDRGRRIGACSVFRPHSPAFREPPSNRLLLGSQAGRPLRCVRWSRASSGARATPFGRRWRRAGRSVTAGWRPAPARWPSGCSRSFRCARERRFSSSRRERASSASPPWRRWAATRASSSATSHRRWSRRRGARARNSGSSESSTASSTLKHSNCPMSLWTACSADSGTCCSRTPQRRWRRRVGFFERAGASRAPSLPRRRRTRGQRCRCRCSWSRVTYRPRSQDNRGSLRSPTPLAYDSCSPTPGWRNRRSKRCRFRSDSPARTITGAF
jgi:hypothetical protein